MTLRHIQIFVCVYKNMSFTRASEELHLAQPSVSLAIKELEEHYCTRLFERLNRRIYPTDDGTKLYNYGLTIISLFEQAENELTSHEKSVTLRIGTSITIGNYILPNLINHYSTNHKNVKINSIIKNSAAIEAAVLENYIDIGLIENEAANRRITQLPLMNDKLCVIVPMNSPLANKKVKAEELGHYDFLVREKGSAGRDIIDSFFSLNNIHINISLESISTQAIIRSVASGIGIAILPYRLVESYVKDKTVALSEVTDMNLSRKFNIIYNKDKFLTQPMKDFIMLCRAENAEEK